MRSTSTLSGCSKSTTVETTSMEKLTRTLLSDLSLSLDTLAQRSSETRAFLMRTYSGRRPSHWDSYMVGQANLWLQSMDGLLLMVESIARIGTVSIQSF